MNHFSGRVQFDNDLYTNYYLYIKMIYQKYQGKLKLLKMKKNVVEKFTILIKYIVNILEWILLTFKLK